jgi:4'-phosphopantetheinyl transferase
MATVQKKKIMPPPTLHPVILAVSETDRSLDRREKVKALGRQARSALRLSANFSGVSLDIKALEKGDLGAPMPQGETHWSLSHKAFFAAAVTAPYPVGIDIEMVKPVKEGLYDRIADEQEWLLASEKNSVAFFRFWTAKEAVLKAIGKGMTGLDHCRVIKIHDDHQIRLSFNGSPWSVIHHWVDERHLVAVTSKGEPISWHMVADSKAISP